MSTEIANIEYGVDVPILFWQVNTICNPRFNAANGKKVQSNVECIYEIASVPIESAQSTYKQDHPHLIEHPDSVGQHTLPSIHWTRLRQSLRYQSITIVAIENY